MQDERLLDQWCGFPPRPVRPSPKAHRHLTLGVHVPDDAAVRLGWAMTEAVDAELRLRTAAVRLGTILADLQAGQPPSSPLDELRQQFIAVRDQLTAIIDVLPQA